MNDSLLVRGVECIKDLPGINHRFVHRQRPFQWLPIHQLHHQIVGTNIVDLADIGVVERGNRPSLTFEPLIEFGLRNFERHSSFQARIAGLINLAHATFTKRGQNFVRTEFIAWSKRH